MSNEILTKLFKIKSLTLWMMDETDDQLASTILAPPSTIP